MPHNKNEEHHWIDSIIEVNQSKLIAYAKGILNDHERAKDVVQDAFIKLYRSDYKKVEHHITPWLFRVVRNLALNVIRKEKRMIQNEDPAQLDIHSTQESEKETVNSIFELINQLPPQKSEIVLLKFRDGFSYKEIANITGLSISNVGYQLHHSIKQLKTEWETQNSK